MAGSSVSSAPVSAPARAHRRARQGQLGAGELLSVGLQGVEHLEVRIQPRRGPFGHHQHFEQQRRLLRKVQLVLLQDAEQLLEHDCEADLRQRTAPVAGRERGDRLPQPCPVDDVGGPGEFYQGGGEGVRVVAGEGEHDAGEAVRGLFGELPDHPEVDQRERAVGLHEHVPGMGVGMEEPVVEHHREHDVGTQPRECDPVDAGGVQALQVVDPHPAHPLQGQHARGRGLPVHAGNPHPRRVGELLREPFGVAGLLQVVQLGTQRAGELLHQPGQVVLPDGIPAPVGAVGEVAENVQVFMHLRDHAGPAHLHDDLGAVVKSCRVRLPDGRRRQRHRVELGEHVLWVGAELFTEHVPNALPRCRGDVVLQFGELGDPCRGEQIVPGGEDLAQFHERRPELLQRDPHMLGVRVGVLLPGVSEGAAVERHQAAQAQHAGQDAESVPAQHGPDLPVPATPRAHQLTPLSAGVPADARSRMKSTRASGASAGTVTTGKPSSWYTSPSRSWMRRCAAGSSVRA